MNFQIFFGFIVVCYICYYLGIVAYDLMVNSKRAASEDDKAQDETVDISDEVYAHPYHSAHYQEAEGGCPETEADQPNANDGWHRGGASRAQGGGTFTKWRTKRAGRTVTRLERNIRQTAGFFITTYRPLSLTFQT